MLTLLVSVRFHDGRYHGTGDWPPAPARMFQALVAGAARGGNLSGRAVEAFKWLESLEAPAIAVPSACFGQDFKIFVPNNDLDAVGGDGSRINEIRTSKIIRPRMFDASVPLVYAWAFAHGADAERHAHTLCDLADNLYQLGRGVDLAWAQSEILDEDQVEVRLRDHGGLIWRPNGGGGGSMLLSPHRGSLASLTERVKRSRERLRAIGNGRRTKQLFSQAPKPSFGPVSYNSRPGFLLFDIERAGVFAPQPRRDVAAFTARIRDLAAERLKIGLPGRADVISRVFIGRDAKEFDKARRVRVTPLPSIGHVQTERSVRRVLVTVPPDCPIALGDISWAFSGLALEVDPEAGEVSEKGAMLSVADDRTMLTHYGIERAMPARVWRSVTPAALPSLAARRYVNPRGNRAEAASGSERMGQHAAAEFVVRQALRHAGIDTPAQAIRVQREPFEARGQRAEASAIGSRFSKERLWHVEITFAEPVAGPLLIGDGRYLGLGLMAPIDRTEGVLAFAVMRGLIDGFEPLELTRALRRAVMARVQEKIGARAALPTFFSGHAHDGATARGGKHEHLCFLFDAPRKRLMIIAPHILERREASDLERANLRTLENALKDFRELRAGAAGKLTLASCHIDTQDDPLLARSLAWHSLTPYRVTRHANLSCAAAALEADLLRECRRNGFPRPEIKVTKTFAQRGVGLFGLARLAFGSAVGGPVVLGRDRHFGGGLFVATP